MTINERLFYILDKKELKANDLANHLGITKGVISNWRKRETPPPSNYIEAICEFLDVSINFLITGKECSMSLSNDNSLSADEDEVLKIYRILDDKAKTIIKGKLYEYEELNLKKQNIIVKKPNSISLNTNNKKEYIELTVYNQKASAGIGKYMLDDVDYEEQEFELDYRTQKADHAIIIEGNSMYPTIEDKQYVFVKEQAKIEHGEIGIFVYEDNVYCKRLCIDRKNKRIILISDNIECDDIIVENIDELRTIGKVIL